MKIISEMTDLELETEIKRWEGIKNLSYNKPKLERLVISWTLENLEKEKERRRLEDNTLW